MFKRSQLPSVRLIAAPLAATLFAAAAITSNVAHAASVTSDWQQLSGSPTATGSLTLISSLYPNEPNILESTWFAAHAYGNGTLQLVGNSTPTSYSDLAATTGTQSATGQSVLTTHVPLPASIWTLLGGIAFVFGTPRARWAKAR